jgi:transposase-like protein
MNENSNIFRLRQQGEIDDPLTDILRSGARQLRESAQSWRELLVEIKRRGLKIAPEIAVGDGALGFWKALDEIFPGAKHQRCWVHKTAKVLNKVALSVQPGMKKDLREVTPRRSHA